MFKIKKNIVLLIRVTIENEQKLETFKEVLAQNPNFEPYSTFTRLDKDRNGYINSSDLKDFLEFNHIFLVSRDILDLYKLLDVNNDGKITYTDFLDSVLPRNNLKLRRICAQRSAYYIAPYHKLPGNIEEYLAKVLREIIESFKMRDNLIKNLMVSEDFYIRDLFNEIDCENKGFINFLDLKTFISKNSTESIPDAELAIFFKNLDLKNKGFVNYSEFMSIFLESGNPRLNSLGNSEKGQYSQEKQGRGLSFSPDTSISKPLTYLPSYKAATSVKKKNQYYDIFKPIKNQKLDFPNRKLQYSVERRTEKSQYDKTGKNWKGGILDRSNNASPFRNEEEKQETNKRTLFGFKAPPSSFNKEQQDTPNEQEDTFRKHRPSNSFDRRNDEKTFTPKKTFPVTGNAPYYLNSKLFSQTPSISQLNSKKMEQIFDNSTQIKEQVALKFPIKPTEKTSPGPVSFAQPKNITETTITKTKEDPIKTPEKTSKFQEDSLVLKEEEEGDIKTNKTPEIKRRSITTTLDEKRDKTYDMPLRPASILKSPSEKKKSLQIDTLQASEKEKQPEPQKLSNIPPNIEIPSRVTQKKEELPNFQEQEIQGSNINERKGSSEKNQERNDTEEPLSGLRDSSKNQTEESKCPLESKDSGQSGANSKVFYKDAVLKESGSFPVNSNSDRSRSDRMLNSMDLRLQQQQQEEYTPVLPHSYTSEIRKEPKNFAGSSEKNLKDDDGQVVGRNKSRTVCSKDLFTKKEDTVNDDGEIEEIDPKSLEKLMSTLESFNETFKEKILTFAQPFIYLLNEEESIHEKKIQVFLDCILTKIFNVSWIAMYLESDLKSPLYLSKNGEKLTQEQLEIYLTIKKKYTKEEFFFEVECEKGLFFYEFKRNNEHIFVLYKFIDVNEENIYYNYFRFIEKYDLFNVCRHTSNFILKSLFIIHEKTKHLSVSYRSLVKYIHEIKEYYLNVFKFLFFEELQKELCFTLNAKINLLYCGESTTIKKRATYNYSSILEVKPISGELRFGVPGEPIIFNLKKEDCKFPEDFIAIYFEQAFSVYHKFEKEIKNFLERSLFYEHFLENTSTVLLDFDKNGLLTFQNMEISLNLKDIFNIKPLLFTTEANELNFQVYFWQLFTHDCPLTTKLLKVLRFRKDLKKIDEFIKTLENFIGTNHRESTPKPNSSVQIVLRAKSGSFKGFYMLLPNFGDQSGDVNSPRKRNLSQLFSKMKMVKNVQAFAFRTAAQAHKNKILKSEKMRNSILRDYLEEKDLVKYKRTKSPQISENEIEMMTKLGSVFEKIRSDHDIKGVNERKVSKYDREFLPRSELFTEAHKLSRAHLVAGVEDVNFNVLDLELEDLHFVVWHLFDFFKFYEKFQVELKTWQEFVWILERKYNIRKNPFHNFYHAVTVAHGCYYFSTKTVMKDFMNNLDQIALIFSGLCHDVSHTGYTNQFEVNTFSKLATRYNDKSVLENHHLATTFRILQDPNKNILEKMDKEDYLRFRKIVITNILATDMKEHFTLMHNFELKIKENNYSIIKLMEQDVEKIQLYSMTVHCCDFFGNAKPFAISKTWSDKVNEEFSHQYHEEVKRNVTPTPYYKDLDINEVRFKNEFSFNKFIIQPLWHVFNKTLNDGVEDCVKNVEDNVANWDRLYNEVLEAKKSTEVKTTDKNIVEENEDEENETDSGNSEIEEKNDEKEKNRLETIEAEEIEEEIEVIKQAKEEEEQKQEEEEQKEHRENNEAEHKE